MDDKQEYLIQTMKANRIKLEPLMAFLPWLEKNAGGVGSNLYGGDGVAESSVAFPVYDGTLMNFIRVAQSSELMDRNYPYVFTRKNLVTPEDIRRYIDAADWHNWDDLCGILSKYVLGGQTRSTLWSEGVSEEIFYRVVAKMKAIVDFWDKPIDLR